MIQKIMVYTPQMYREYRLQGRTQKILIWEDDTEKEMLTVEKQNGTWTIVPTSNQKLFPMKNPGKQLESQIWKMVGPKNEPYLIQLIQQMDWEECVDVYTIADETCISIGREKNNTICIQGNPLVSSRHGMIQKVGTHFYLTDYSVNGIYVNGERIRKRRRLERGDVLYLYGVKLFFGERKLAVQKSHGWEWNIKLPAWDKQEKENQVVLQKKREGKTAMMRYLCAGFSFWKRDFGMLPTSLSLLSCCPDLLQNIEKKWETSAMEQKICAVVGMDQNGIPVKLDLDETGDGPHGIVAGMTGYGKSEFLQSMLLSLALRYHPACVQFLLLDWKGAGMANRMQELPHVAGILSDMEPVMWNRVIAALEKQIENREKILMQANVENIRQYNEKAKGLGREWMSHILVVADEFAELKHRCPKMATLLLRLSRVGRSLGLHMILSCQRVDGVVEEEIQNNSGFLIQFYQKEQSKNRWFSQAEELQIRQRPGEAVLCGRNRMVLFQSAWSNGSWIEQERQKQEWERFGFCPKTEKCNTEREWCVKVAKEQANRLSHFNGIKPLWLPGLKEYYELPQVRETDMWYLGIMDEPQIQKQYTGKIKWDACGHILVAGQRKSGRSSVLKSMVYQLLQAYTPEQVWIYLADFDGEDWSTYERMPHIAGICRKAEQFEKMLLVLEKELETRKQSTLEKTFPKLLVYIDSFDAFQADTKGRFRRRMGALLEQEDRLNLQVVLTAGNTAEYALPLKWQELFTTKIWLGCENGKKWLENAGGSDESKYRKGRAGIEQKGCVTQCQLFSLSQNRAESLSECYADKKYEKNVPKPLYFLPDFYNVDSFWKKWVQIRECLQGGMLPFACEELTGHLFALQPKDAAVYICIGETQSERDGMLSQVREVLKRETQLETRWKLIENPQKMASNPAICQRLQQLQAQKDVGLILFVLQQEEKYLREHKWFVELLKQAAGIYMGKRWAEQTFFEVEWENGFVRRQMEQNQRALFVSADRKDCCVLRVPIGVETSEQEERKWDECICNL